VAELERLLAGRATPRSRVVADAKRVAWRGSRVVGQLRDRGRQRPLRG
jgi:hypothetical protein